MKMKMVAQYESPQLQEFANSFATWLTRKMNGRLPAPHIRLVGASEDLWPVLHHTARLAGDEGGFPEWCGRSDACAFPFFALAADGETQRLDQETKSQLLPLLFPYYPPGCIATLHDYDAVIFLRLDRLPNVHRQTVVTAHEAAYICSTWLGNALTGQNLAGNVEEEQLLSWLNEYSAEREQR